MRGKDVKTLKRLEKFEPNYVHILPRTHEGNYAQGNPSTIRSGVIMESEGKRFLNAGTPGVIGTKIGTHITYNPEKKL